jgi:RNA polymerase sigma-70 factor (ECF subfamily)
VGVEEERRGSQIIEQARRGDPQAWAELYERFSGSIFGYLYNRLRLSEPAEDLVAKTFMEALEGIGRFQGDLSGMRAWLFSIARHNLFDHLRRESRAEITPLDDVAHEDLSRLAPAAGPEDQAISAIERSRVLEAIGELSKDQQEVVLLRLNGGLTSKEIAEVVGKTAGAVKALQHRAMRALARSLAQGPPDW